MVRELTHWIEAADAKTGELIKGLTRNDGLQSMWAVTTASGEVRYVTTLDHPVLTRLTDFNTEGK